MSFIASLVAISDWKKMDSTELSSGKAYPDTKGVANATVGRNSNKCHLPENQVPTPIYEVRDSRFSEQISLVMMGIGIFFKPHLPVLFDVGDKLVQLIVAPTRRAGPHGGNIQ